MQKFDVNKLRVASPCSVGWETMTGDERVRHCHACQLNIYNTAEMTTVEVQTLIENREGRLCIRMYRRADGTVLTRDCPVGLKAFRKRVSIFAGAVVSSVLGLFSVTVGQSLNDLTTTKDARALVRTLAQDQRSELTGCVVDPNGATISNATIRLSKDKGKVRFKTTSDSDGQFRIKDIPEGVYKVEITASGFKRSIYQDVKIVSQEAAKLNVTLEISGGSVTVGIYVDEPLIDLGSTSITHTVYRRKDN